MQDEEPVEALMLPAGHRMHCDERLAPTRELKAPRLHGIQLVAPAVSE